MPFVIPNFEFLISNSSELDAEAARMEAVRGLIPAFEAKIARTLTRVWGTA